MTWLNTKEVAAEARRSTATVRRAAEGDLLHGHQPVDRQGRPIANARWSFHQASVTAWIQGHDLHAQKQACGCPMLRAVPGRGRRAS